MFSASPSPLHIFGHQLNFEVVLPTGQGIPPCDVAAQPTLVQPASRRVKLSCHRDRAKQRFFPHPLQFCGNARVVLALPCSSKHSTPPSTLIISLFPSDFVILPLPLSLSPPASIAAISSNIHQFHSSREKREGGDKKSTWDGRISVGARRPARGRGRDSDPTEKEWDGSEHRREKGRCLKSTDMTFIHFSSVVVVSPTTIIVIGMSCFK